ncbi:MAG: AAA domain-containing protein [Bacteroidales bacterium]|nr:AAA domain-containing protein [Bacteroidales bacterium]
MQARNAIQELSRHSMLLRMEYEAEKEAYLKQTKEMGVPRKVKRGMCWYPVRIGQSYYNSLNQLVVELHRTQDRDIEHSFEYGKPVTFFTWKGDGSEVKFLPIVATVSYVDEDRMVIALPQKRGYADIVSSENLGVQLYFDETTYRLMFEALNSVIGAKKGRLMELRELIYGNAPFRKLNLEYTHSPGLNPTQEIAVNEVLKAKDVMVVHGPPGTGKTTTLVEAVYETLRRECQVMVCAQSNMAVDWISEKLVDSGLSVLRVGNPTRVNDKMLSFTYEQQFSDHPDYPQLWSIRKAIRDLQKNKNKSEGTRKKIMSLKDRETELEHHIREQLFAQNRVIACTLSGSANKVLDGMKFSTLFIDEAAQALEAACWIAISKADRVILAGDHQQLPPTIKCYEAARQGLDQTLMEKIVSSHPESVSLLQVQYRMNEDIMRFSSDYFYEGKVQSAPSVKSRFILDPEIDDPVVWVNTAGMDCNEEFVQESFGRINKPEADLSIQQLKDYFTKIGPRRIMEDHVDVGIISPYKAQVQYIRQRVKSDPFFKPYRHLVTINTVDGFQGQERDVIIISLVRANENGEIGFLRDLRRMNVAMTRARMKLIIMGDASTLTRHPFYRKLYESIATAATRVEQD